MTGYGYCQEKIDLGHHWDLRVNLNVDLFMYLIEGSGLVHEKIDVSTGPYFFCFLLNCNSLTLHPSLCFEFYYSTTLLQKRNKDQSNNLYFSQVEHSRITVYIHILTFTQYVFENKDYSKMRYCSQKLYIDQPWQ